MENEVSQKWILFAISQFISCVDDATDEQLMIAYASAQESGTLTEFERLGGCVWQPFENHEESEVVSLIEDMVAELQRIDNQDQRRVIVTVRGGVGDYIADTGVDVVLIDYDWGEEPSVPERFRDLAEPCDIAVEGDNDESNDSITIRVRLEGDSGSVEIVEFSAKDVLEHNGESRTWEEVGEDESHLCAQAGLAEDYALWIAKRSKGDMGDYRVDVLEGA